MRFLKKKVFLYSRERPIIPSTPEVALTKTPSQDSISLLSQSTTDSRDSYKPRKDSFRQTSLEAKKESKVTSSKTIVKNFGKAMCAFAASELAMPYLKQIVEQGANVIKSFQMYIKKKKNGVDSIESLRSLLLIGRGDGEEVMLYKKIFQEVSIIFIKYFSVNWIFQGKMAHKQAHLRARFKMLRRVQNPEYFTYFKGFVKEADAKREQ